MGEVRTASQLAGKPGRSIDYRTWFQARFQWFLRQWAAILLATLVINLKGDGMKHGVKGIINTLQASLSCIGVLWGLRDASTRLVYWSFIAFALVQLVIHYELANSSEKGASIIHVVFDIVVLPLTKVPRMLVTEADPWTFLSIFVGDVFVSARFYLKIVGHSIILSCLRAVLMHSLCVACYLKIRAQTRRAYQVAQGLTNGEATNASMPNPAAISGSVSQPGKSNKGAAHKEAGQDKVVQQMEEEEQKQVQKQPQEVPQEQRGPVLATTVFEAVSSEEVEVAPSLAVQRELKKALSRKACAQQRAAYATRIDSGSVKAKQYVQETSRFAIKMVGSSTPDLVPDMSLHLLQQRLRRYANLRIEGPSVRAGCVVISFNAEAPFSSIQDAKNEILSVVKEWALENGLTAADADELFIQACSQQMWGSLPQGPFSLALNTPIVVASPPTPGVQSSQHQHQAQPAPGPPLESVKHALEDSCVFELTLLAPQEFELRGWHGKDDAPEELPEDVKSRSLCLLASMDGGREFLATTMERLSVNSNGEGKVQARVSLPARMFDVPHSPIAKVMVLELWAAGEMVCSYAAVVLPSQWGGSVLAELEDWNPGDGQEKETFVSALVQWMSFHARSSTSQQQQQQQQQDLRMAAEGDEGSDAADALALMADQGKALLDCSLESGMLAVAGLLVDGLMRPPFRLPLHSLLGNAESGGDQHALASDGTSEPPCVASGPAGGLPPRQQPFQGLAVSEPNGTVKPQLSAYGHGTISSKAGQHAAPSATSLWAQAARGSIRGFQQASDAECRTKSGQYLQKEQQQQQACLGPPTEAGFRLWGEAYMRHFTNIRFKCACLGAVATLFKSKELLQSMLLIVNVMPYICYFNTPKVGLRIAKYVLFAFWLLMGTGLYDPSSTTKNMVLFKAEVLVLVLFFSPVHEQAGLRALLLERALTTIVQLLLYRGLNIEFFVLRSVLVNLVSLSVEFSLDVYFRYLFLKHMADQQPQGQQNQQQQLQQMPLHKKDL